MTVKVKQIINKLRNPYIILSGAVLVWILFFDQYNAIRRYRDYQVLQNLEADKRYYQLQIRDVEKRKKELLTDDATKERFAREHYFMKKDGEEIYEIEEE